MARNGTDNLVNHTLKNLIQGVSEQVLESRLESQVDEMENCIPHLSRGILRRNPLKYVNYVLDNGVEINPEDYFVYSYDRGTDTEQYLIFIGNLKWYSFNANTGEMVGKYTALQNSLEYLNTNGKHPKDVFSLVTVGDYTWISNSEKTTAMRPTFSDNGDTELHKRKIVLWVKKVINTVVSTDSSGNAHTMGLTYTVDITGHPSRVVFGSSAPYINPYDGLEKYAERNKTYQIAGALYHELKADNNDAGYVLDSETRYSFTSGHEYYVTEDSKEVTGIGTVYYDKYVWDGKVVEDNDTYTYQKNLEVQVGFTTFWKITRVSKVYNEDKSLSNWKNKLEYTWSKGIDPNVDLSITDGFGGEAMLGMKGVIRKASDLPAKLPLSIGDVLVKIDSSEEVETGSEYWMKWNDELWRETRAPGLQNEIDETTMPHVFVRQSDGTFDFGFYGETTNGEASLWTERLKGDLDSAPEPSFIGKNISSIFFHNNRLGVLAEDNIIMSELSEYGNFWPTTVKTIPDTDPIDITAATRDVTGLKTAVSISGSLLLFSNNNQFILTSTGGNLTPESAVINNVSSYNYNELAPAVVIGNKVFFSSESGNGSQIFNFALDSVLTTGSENVAANNLSLHIPSYLPKNIRTIIGHSILGYIFIHSYDDPKTLYVLNTITVDAQSAQQAFHKWTFKEDIVDIGIIKNDLNIVFKNDTKMRTTKMSLDIPHDTSIVNYEDQYDELSYDYFPTEIRFSKWQIKNGDGYGTMRGRLQIRTAMFATKQGSIYDVKLINDSLLEQVSNWVLGNGEWNDSNSWDDSKIWLDSTPYKERIYNNDDKVSVLSNAADTFIIFKNSEEFKNKGFELSTINLEGMFRQRSSRL